MEIFSGETMTAWDLDSSYVLDEYWFIPNYEIEDY